METSIDIIKLLIEIQTTRGTTVLVASHDMETVKSSNKRIIRIEDGSVISDRDRPKEIAPKAKSEEGE